MFIRPAADEDRETVFQIHEQAFGSTEEAELTIALLDDPSAQPVISLLVERDGAPVGHVLFTSVRIEPDRIVDASILAPLAVVPACQGQGIGNALVTEGLKQLEAGNTHLAFVLGDPSYYGRFGFQPASKLGLHASYPLPAKYADAWMVKLLGDGLPDDVEGQVICADSLNKPEYWIS